MPRIALIRWRSEFLRGDPLVLSSHVVKSLSRTSCSTATLVTRTLTEFSPYAISVTQSSLCMAAIPGATAS